MNKEIGIGVRKTSPTPTIKPQRRPAAKGTPRTQELDSKRIVPKKGGEG